MQTIHNTRSVGNLAETTRENHFFSGKGESRFFNFFKSELIKTLSWLLRLALSLISHKTLLKFHKKMSPKKFSVSWEVFVVFLHNPQLRSQRRNLRSYESLVCVPKGKALNRFELRAERRAWDGTKTRLLHWKALVMKYFSFYFITFRASRAFEINILENGNVYIMRTLLFVKTLMKYCLATVAYKPPTLFITISTFWGKIYCGNWKN